MSDKQQFEVTWYVDDGYVTGDRPKHTTLDLSDFEEDMDVDAIEREITRQVQYDYDRDVTWCCDEIDELAREIHAALHNDEEAE